MLPREFCCSWSYKRYFVLIVRLLCTQPFCLRKGRTKPQHFFSVQSQINFKFTRSLHFFCKMMLVSFILLLWGPYGKRWLSPTARWLHFVVEPWPDCFRLRCYNMAWIRLLHTWVVRLKPRHVVLQIFPPSAATLCDLPVHRAAGKFIPGEAGWGAGHTGILLLLRNPTKLTGSSGGCGERKQRLPPLERWWWWVRDDSGKMERPSQCGGSTSERITRAELKITMFPVESVSSL